ncbi:MAG: GlsB/YeaQ/YmgE family stress response membrane protein [Chloroflexi bacterium]|nr:GlsB/YeaQ/YmgE family stress response membrane protein [Chloroflexota bacterium]
MTVGEFIRIYGSIFTWIITGAIAGGIASALLRTQRQGCLVNVAIGIIGAFIGGFIMNNILLPGGVFGVGLLDAMVNATVGAVIFLVVLELLLPGQQLGVRDEGGKGRRR